jgi:EAL domain-containing protein (putative c-di-GMP-specific phosphodiesterase class I)
VVAEGIENEEQFTLALEAGAMWQQGYHHGAPGLTRSWRWSPQSLACASRNGFGELLVPPSNPRGSS